MSMMTKKIPMVPSYVASILISRGEKVGNKNITNEIIYRIAF